jgi:translocation and assembly module TamA
VAFAHAVAFALGATLAACHHRVHKPGDEWLKSVDITGNAHMDGNALRDGLALHRVQERGGHPDPYLVAIDADRVRGQYLRRGFFDVGVQARVDRVRDATTVTFDVDEGTRSTTRVAITGIADPELRHKIRAQLPLADGAPFDYAVYDGAKAMMLGVVEDAGYAHARLDARVVADRATHEAIVQLAYTTGPPCAFGDVTITGASDDLEDAVRARLAFAHGDRYSVAALTATQRNLYGMARFSTVRVEPEKTNAESVAVRVTVVESQHHELGLGGGFGVDPISYEVRGRASYTLTGWPTALDTVGIDLRPAYAYLRDGGGYEPRIKALAKYSRLDLVRPYVIGEVEGGYDYITIEGYTYYGPRARLGVLSPLGTQRVQLRVGWRIQDYNFRRLNALIDPVTAHELGLDHDERVGAYQQAVIVDLRDNPLETTKGAYGEVRVDEASRYAGGSYDFVQVSPELRGFVPIGPHVLAARARYGAFFGDVPATERYYSGGANTQRGFSERRLAPTLFGTVDNQMRSIPIGGGALVETNVELRARVATIRKLDVGGVVFVDGADVTDRPSDIDLAHLHWAVGAGLRVFTIVGAIRADVGYRLNRTGPMEPEPSSHYAFHFSIGEAY